MTTQKEKKPTRLEEAADDLNVSWKSVENAIRTYHAEAYIDLPNGDRLAYVRKNEGWIICVQTGDVDVHIQKVPLDLRIACAASANDLMNKVLDTEEQKLRDIDKAIATLKDIVK